MADQTLFVVTYRNGEVISGIDGLTATELFDEAKDTENPCSVSLLDRSYKSP